MSDPVNPQDSEELLKTVSYQIFNGDSYLLGPYGSLTKVKKDSLDVPARLAGKRQLEYNFDKLKGMGVMDAAVQMKGLTVHLAMLHMERVKTMSGNQPHLIRFAQLATELATWHKMEHGAWKVSDKFPKPSHFGFPEHLSAEQYFKLLVEKNKPEPQESQPQPQPGEAPPEEQSFSDFAKDAGSKQKGEYHAQDQSKWNEVSEIEQEATREQVMAKLEHWMKSRGTVPAGLKRLFDDILNAKKEKWYDKIKNLVGNRMASANRYRYTRKKPSRRLGVPNAGRQKMRRGALVVAIDTSGSISDVEMGIFAAKMRQIAKAFEAPYQVIVCDCKIQCTKTIRRMKDIELIDFKGGGGTSSLPVFEKLQKEPVDLLVYLTDLEIDFPEVPPKFDVIWGVINPRRKNDLNLKAPFGKTYQLEIDEEQDRKLGGA